MVNLPRLFNPCRCGCNLSKGQCADKRSYAEWEKKWNIRKAAEDAERIKREKEEMALYEQLSPLEKLEYKHKKRMEEIAEDYAAAHNRLARNTYRSDSMDGFGL